MKKQLLIVGKAYEKESSCVEDVLAIAGALARTPSAIYQPSSGATPLFKSGAPAGARHQVDTSARLLRRSKS